MPYDKEQDRDKQGVVGAHSTMTLKRVRLGVGVEVCQGLRWRERRDGGLVTH